MKLYSICTEAVAEFKNLYLEKTGNEFGTKEFVKKPGKYNQMHVENQEIPHSLLLSASHHTMVPSQLSEPICRLMELLFDVKIMESALLGFDLDIEKMPLGKISKNQIKTGMKLLQEISLLLHQKTFSHKIIEASNQFYSQIPHNFGLRRPPVIDTMEMIKDKFEMLDAMQQMEITYYLLSMSGDADAERNPVDITYERLRRTAEIGVLDPASAEYDEISDYVKNTQLQPYNYLQNLNEFELVEVFTVSRREEVRRFRLFEETANRKLLWHGTRLTNFIGILTNGLKIAPPAASMSGSRFGRGIYFSDCITKSAGYCRVSGENTTGLLLLCEVALGRSQESLGRSLPLQSGYDSLQGLGHYYPLPNHVRADGLIVPNGNLVQSGHNTAPLFNEFVVYDESRVKIRYVVKLNFKAPRMSSSAASLRNHNGPNPHR